MSVLVLGAGLQGNACAFDLLETTNVAVTLADRGPSRVPPYLQPHVGKRLTLASVDARDATSLGSIMAGHAAVLSALPYYFNADAARLAIEAGAHFADLGGNTEIVRRQESFDAQARLRGVSVIPDNGVAPGMVNILAVEAMRQLDSVNSLRLYVGGLPQKPLPPLNYNIVYSLEGVIDYYTTPSWILRGGKAAQVEALSELEDVPFTGLGNLEAFHTAGGASTMPWEYAGKVRSMEYKTLRYPGHAEIIQAIRQLGLFDLKPVDVKGQKVAPRDVFVAVADPRLRGSEPDLIALRVVAEGKKKGKKRKAGFELLDRADQRRGISAMMRTTGYSLSITGQLQLAGKTGGPGVRVSYQAVPFEPYVAALKKRGIKIRELGG